MTAQDLKGQTGQTAADQPPAAPTPPETMVEPAVEVPEAALPPDPNDVQASPEEMSMPPLEDPPSMETEPTADAAQPVEFEPLDASSAPQAGENLDLLLDVTVALSVELGGTVMPLSEILGLGPNSVVKLDRAVGEPVGIFINRELVGRGEVVVVEDHLGVRVTELLKSPASSKPGSPQ